MKFSNWTVMTDNKRNHSYFYGSLNDFEPDDYKGLTIVPIPSWEAEDYSEIIGNIAEDHNYHGICGIFPIILETLQKNNLSKATQTNIMREISRRINREIFGTDDNIFDFDIKETATQE